MRYIYQHIATIISSYNGSLPLTHFLKNYFKQYPKLGSRDRKILSEMTYCWYRCERSIDSSLSFEDRIHASLYLCATNYKVINPLLPADLQLNDSLTRAEKLNNLVRHYPVPEKTKKDKEFHHFLTGNSVFHFHNLWTLKTKFSNGIDKYEWLQTMLVQPRMFIRVRKNRQQIEAALIENKIPCIAIGHNCISLPNGSPIDKILNEADYVVQDASSQQTARFFNPLKQQNWWDCCSGAGGKSLLLMDKEPGIQLTVSDTRNTILHNLQERFKLYSLPLPASIVLDVTDKKQVADRIGKKKFNGIICDVPCTGSGTWARTPEQLYFFQENQLREITQRQKAIALNAISQLEQNGTFIYITCSVFKEENEDVVAHITKYKHSFVVKDMQLINGTEIGADSMFIAVLQRRTTASAGG